MAGHFQRVLAMLDAGHDANQCDESGRSVLSQAVGAGADRTANLLLDRGADVNVVDEGWTLLMRSAYKGDLDTCDVLLFHGALIDLQDKDGITGVYSLSAAVPIKQARFASRFSSFEARPARSYRDWIFTTEQAALAPVPAPDPNSSRVPARTLSSPLDLIDVPHIAPGANNAPSPSPTSPQPQADPGGRTLTSPLGL